MSIIDMEDAIRATHEVNGYYAEVVRLRADLQEALEVGKGWQSRAYKAETEVERLKRENAELQIQADAICEGCQYATHYKRLEAALREIADKPAQWHIPDWAVMVQIARAALEGEKDE